MLTAEEKEGSCLNLLTLAIIISTWQNRNKEVLLALYSSKNKMHETENQQFTWSVLTGGFCVGKSRKMVKMWTVSFTPCFLHTLVHIFWVVMDCKKGPIQTFSLRALQTKLCWVTPQSSRSSQQDQWMLTVDQVVGFGLKCH